MVGVGHVKPSQVLMLRMRGAVPPLLQMPSWYAQVKLVT